MDIVSHDEAAAPSLMRIKKLISYLYVLAFPFLLFVCMETLNTADEVAKLRVTLDISVILISGFALFLVFAFLFCITGNIFTAGAVLFCVVGFMYVFSYYRLILTGWVFVPSDLSLIRQTRDLAGFANLSMFPAVIIAAFINVPLLVLLFFTSKKITVGFKFRMASSIVFLAAFAFIFFTPLARRSILPKFSVDVTMQLPPNNMYRQKGVLMGFYSKLYYVDETLADYNQQYMLNLVEEVKNNLADKSLYEENKKNPAAKPNVIVIMSEAFSDPTVFNGIEYSEHPFENINNLHNAAKGSILTPVIGGGTCNTEYEFLTGNSIAYTGYNIKPYEMENEFIPEEDNSSLPSLFSRNGYKTVSVHPYYRDFFNRDTIHPKLGFDESVFLEDMENPEYKGDYVSDEYFIDTMLDIIDKTEEPLFLFGISMQNHYCFYGDKYEEYDVISKSDILDHELKESLDSYVQGIYDADKQFKRLLDNLAASDDPTIVVFFGDHKPLLGKSAFQLYVDIGYIHSGDILEWTTEQKYKMFTTPYVVWNNYGEQDKDWGDISPYFLGALVAEQSGIDLNLYYKFLLQAYDSYHGLTDSLFIDKNDKVYTRPTPEARKAVSIFRAFQYDRIKGSGYVEDLLSEM